MSDKLSALQRELIAAFFARSDEYFLTGGAALAGYFLGHRTTEDLDLFAGAETDAATGVRALRAAAAAVGAELEGIQETPDFRRFAARRGTELTIVDLVIDRVPPLVADKEMHDGVRVDPLREIAANKLCALLGRTAPRDLVDLRALLEHGLVLEDVLADARSKDGAADPATLAWVLDRYRITGGAPLPTGVDATELDDFRQGLVDRLARLALPED